ncbi:MAG: energy-coupling factor transporter ATPase [Clostridia bacterium]|nr:energy-coupling factor transporter ATPase [Clostridia bacterium]
MSEILKTEDLVFSYNNGSPVKRAAINKVSFTLKKGETLGIIGHTGSGKSTLVQTLNGLIKPESGTVFLDGEDLWKNPKQVYQKRFRVGLVFQYPEYQLFEETVYKDIAFGPKNMGLSEEEIDFRIKKYISLLGLNLNYLEKSPFDLSGGEKRRVALAGILAMEPEVLVLDEPTAGLDPVGRENLFKAIELYKKERSAAVIIVSHSMEDLARLSDKLLVMNLGEAKMFGTVEEVFARYEELSKMGLDVPVVTKILLELKALGLNVNTKAFTPAQAIKNIELLLKEGDINA